MGVGKNRLIPEKPVNGAKGEKLTFSSLSNNRVDFTALIPSLAPWRVFAKIKRTFRSPRQPRAGLCGFAQSKTAPVRRGLLSFRFVNQELASLISFSLPALSGRGRGAREPRSPHYSRRCCCAIFPLSRLSLSGQQLYRSFRRQGRICRRL